MNGKHYKGQWKNDKRHGMGGIWTADGLVYMGQWQKGARHGAGIVAHADSVEVDLRGTGTLEEVSVPPKLQTCNPAMKCCSASTAFPYLTSANSLAGEIGDGSGGNEDGSIVQPAQ